MNTVFVWFRDRVWTDGTYLKQFWNCLRHACNWCVDSLKTCLKRFSHIGYQIINLTLFSHTGCRNIVLRQFLHIGCQQCFHMLDVKTAFAKCVSWPHWSSHGLCVCVSVYLSFATIWEPYRCEVFVREIKIKPFWCRIIHPFIGLSSSTNDTSCK